LNSEILVFALFFLGALTGSAATFLVLSAKPNVKKEKNVNIEKQEYAPRTTRLKAGVVVNNDNKYWRKRKWEEQNS
jgi:hypothetical protein